MYQVWGDWEASKGKLPFRKPLALHWVSLEEVSEEKKGTGRLLKVGVGSGAISARSIPLPQLPHPILLLPPSQFCPLPSSSTPVVASLRLVGVGVIGVRCRAWLPLAAALPKWPPIEQCVLPWQPFYDSGKPLLLS